MTTVADFIRRWFDEPAARTYRGWRSTPDRIGRTATVRPPFWGKPEEVTEILAVRLRSGKVISNSGVLTVARAEPMAYGVPRTAPEAPSQQLCIELGSLPVPFGALHEAGVSLPEDFSEPIPQAFEVADWKGPETVTIDHRHQANSVCDLCGTWQTRASFRQEERHYTGADLVVQSTKHFLFDLDRGELCHGRWNPFICLLEKGIRARTVEEAYDSLMPSAVRDAKAAGLDVQRQGEWFFIPDETFQPPRIDPALLEAVRLRPHPLGYGVLEENIVEWDGTVQAAAEKTDAVVRFEADLAVWEEKLEHLRRLLPSEKTLQVEGSRGHTVSRAIELPDGGIYVTGKVKAPDHDDLVLDRWCRVVPNAAARSFRITGAID